MDDRVRSASLVLAFAGLLTGCDGCDESTSPSGGAGGEGGSAGGNPPQGGTPNDGGGGNGAGGQGGLGGQGGATPQTLNVIVTVIGEPGGEPLEGVTVIASTDDTSLAAEATTSADGIAMITQPSGGSVSVLRLNQTGFFNDGQLIPQAQRETRTFYLEGSGEIALEVHVDRDLDPFPVVDPMSLSFEVEAVAGATEYEITLPCGYRQDVAVGTAFIDPFTCDGQPFDAILVARDDDKVVLDYAFQAAVPYQAGADVVLSLPFGKNPLVPMQVDATFSTAETFSSGSYGIGAAGLAGPLFMSQVQDANPTSPFSTSVPQMGSYPTRWCGLALLGLPSDAIAAAAACGAAPITQMAVDEDAIGTVGGMLTTTTVSYTVDDNGPLGQGVQLNASGLSAADELCVWRAYKLPGQAGTFTFPGLPVAQNAFTPTSFNYAELQHIQFSDDIEGDFMGHVASLPAQLVTNVGAGYLTSVVYLGP